MSINTKDETKSTSGDSIEIVNNFIKNPVTGRAIKVGGRIFNQLVSKNILKLPENDLTKVIYVGNNPETALAVKKSLNLSDGKHSLKVRGNNIVQERRRVTKAEIQKKMQDVTLKIYHENASLFTDDMNVEQVGHLLQNLINEKIVGGDGGKLVKDCMFVLDNIEEVEPNESETEEN